MERSDAISVLDDLLHVSRDGVNTFEKAVGMTKDPELETAFRTALRSCLIATEQLREKIEDLGGKPKEGGTVPGLFHRAWIDARTLLAREEDQALLDEIVKAERSAVRQYDEAMTAPLPEDVRSLVVSQASGAKANLRRFEGLAATSSGP